MTQFKKSAKLSGIERKYCSCLVKVRSGSIKPYGICTRSVYGSRKIKRTKTVKCSKGYKLPSLKKSQLVDLAKEKKLRVNNKMKKSQVISMLKEKLYKD